MRRNVLKNTLHALFMEFRVVAETHQVAQQSGTVEPAEEYVKALGL